jgi:prophage regulatory protein
MAEQYLRVREILEQYIRVCSSTWWAGVKSGRYPQPVYISPRVPVWSLSDILKLTKDGVRRRVPATALSRHERIRSAAKSFRRSKLFIVKTRVTESALRQNASYREDA